MDPARFTIINIGCLSMNKFWGETERVRQASATCTLLEGSGRRLLVDPSPYPEQLAVSLFNTTGLLPEAIDSIYVTHHHGDHRYGLGLFSHAKWLMAVDALAEWRERAPEDAATISRFVPAENQLPDGITLYSAPGHTHCLHALSMVSVWGKLIVAGDAVMTPEFLAEEQGYHNSVDFGVASETIRRIKADADVIVPGHGNIILNRRHARG